MGTIFCKILLDFITHAIEQIIVFISKFNFDVFSRLYLTVSWLRHSLLSLSISCVEWRHLVFLFNRLPKNRQTFLKTTMFWLPPIEKNRTSSVYTDYLLFAKFFFCKTVKFEIFHSFINRMEQEYYFHINRTQLIKHSTFHLCTLARSIW